MKKLYNFFIKYSDLFFLCITISLTIYVFYKSEIYWDGKKREYYFIYYLILIFLTFFSFVLFFLNNFQKKIILFNFVLIFIITYIAEIYITFKGGPLTLEKLALKEKITIEEQVIKETLYFNNTGKKYDTKDTKTVYKELKSKGEKIVVKVPPITFLKKELDIQPLSGISNSKTLSCNENGYYSIYFSDRYGFNNPDYEWDKEKIEYLLVGDSMTFGECVNRPHDIGSILRKRSEKGVLNLGYGSNGPLIYYASLREYLDLNVNKILILFFEGNDLINLNEELENKILKNYLDDINYSQNLKLKQSKIDKIVHQEIIDEQNRFKNKITENSNLNKFNYIKFIKLFNLRYLIKNPNHNSMKELSKILKLSNDLAKNKNAKLYFIYLPEYFRYKLDYNYTNKDYKRIKKIVNKLGITFIDIHKEVFDKENNPLDLFPFGFFGHYNVEGYEKVGNAIFRLTSK